MITNKSQAAVTRCNFWR